MYSGWISNRTSVEDDCGSLSVLNSYPPNVGKDVTSSIIRSLVHHPSEKKNFFKTDKDLDWTMDVICFGLTMPLAEVEMIKNCVFLYLDWTSVMSPKPKPGIPMQILEKREFYFSRMLNHLTNLFIPRESAATVLQAKFCSQVLYHIRSIVQESALEKATSEMILKFYLGISSHLLSVPPLQGGLAEHLCEQLINCVLTVWLHVSCHHFPSPTLWCTLREIVLTWRHHHILISQWNKLMYVLTCKVLIILFGPNYPLPRLYKDDISEPILLPHNLTDELTVQCWFRFLHIIGNPVSLCKVNEICGTEYFMQYSLEQGRQPDSHPSLKSLPNSFYKAMKGISVLVAMFLGSSQNANKRSYSISSQSFARGEWKSASTGTITNKSQSNVDLSDKSVTVPGVRRIPDQSRTTKLARDDCNLTSKAPLEDISADTNCILHLFGSWLFEVCLSGVNIDQILQSVGTISCGLRPSSLHLTKEEREQFGSFPPAKKNDFEPGRAQAFSTLCHIFCHQRTTGQAILPVYLSRFYLSLAVGLCYGETRAGQVLGSILLTAKDLLRLDLQGVQVLVPHILQALEIILPTQDRELVLGYDVSLVELRRSCIQILLSMLCLPLHFLSLSIQGLCREKAHYVGEGGTGNIPQVTFLSLKERMTKLLMQAIEVESNAQNTQILLGGAMLLMEDTMCVEFKNYEFSKQNPGSLPCILLDDTDRTASGSPKLIHIAKTTRPIKQATSGCNRTKLDKKDIGILGKKEDILTTKGQVVHMTTLLCQKLMFGKWKGELHVTLTALECISGMAQLDSKFIDKDAAHKSLIWICDYIEFQARQPPPAHSKDLHSIIIAAFSCISAWIVNHPWLMDDQYCLHAVLEVIELGISGSKSRPRSPDTTPSLKGDKELKSVSLRVREAAEALLALIMENLGYFPTPCGPASLSSLLDEEQLLRHSENKENRKFRYYALDGTVIIALQEDPIKGAAENLPSVTSIMRGPVGKRVCLLQLRHFSRAKQHLADGYKLQPEKPLGLQETPSPPKVSQQCYPSEVNRVKETKADLSIPTLNRILNEKEKEVQEHVAAVMAVQKEQEEQAQTTRKANSFGLGGYNADISQKQPSPVDDHCASRLFLSHMSMLRLENLQTSTTHQPAGLQSLHSIDDTMELALKKLDCFPARTFDTMYVFFVKRNQHDATEIINNKVPSVDNQFFMEFLHSMGWKVNLASHTGWNGNLNTSWKPKTKQDTNGKHMFYYADLLTELAIHVPALNHHIVKKSESYTKDDASVGRTEQIPVFEINDATRRTSEGDVLGRPVRKHAHFEQTGSVEVKHRFYNSQSETKVVVAWLQDFNDNNDFPALDLVELNDPQEYSYSVGNPAESRVPDKEVVVVFIHPLKTGLFRIMTRSVFGSTISGPLMDGMVVSRRVLGAVVRNTVVNICRRRRLEIDNYSPPHVCRKIKIQEIIRKHSHDSNIPEFYASMFK